MLLAMANRWRIARCRTGAAKRRLLVLLVVVAALLLFAPSIVLHTPLRQQVLTAVIPPTAGSVTVKNLSAGWLTPVTATGVVLFDTAGNRLADVERLSIDRTVVGLLGDRRDLGTIRLENATIYALVRGDGSNLEDTLNKVVAANDNNQTDQLASSGGGPSYKIEVVNGRLLSRNAATGETWSADSLAATVSHPAGGPLRVEATGMVRPATDNKADGNWAAQPNQTIGRFELRWGGDDTQQLSGIRFVCQDLPLMAIEPWLQRADPQLQITGVLTGELSLAYPVAGYDSLSGDTTGRIALTNFAITGSALAGEQLAIDETNLAWKCTASGGRASVENLSLASDIAMFDLRGTLDERAVRAVAAGTAEPLALATHGDLEAEGRINLAQLAQRLPELFKVREGTTLTSGQVRFNARSMPQADGHQITASLTTSALAGTTRGRAIEWNAPLDVNLKARHVNNGWRFDQLSCKSQFLEVAGSGDAQHMQVTGLVNLDELSSRLDQFVDLTDWQLAGRGELAAACRRDANGQFVAEGTGTLDDFVIAYRGKPLATEPRLEWAADFEGASPSDSIWPNRLSRGEISLAAAGDELTAELTEPTEVKGTWAATAWPVNLATNGQLEGWSRRLRPWVDLSAWQTGGQLELSARGQVRVTPLNVNIVDSAMTIDHLRATTTDWNIDEPRVEWAGDLAWDSTTSTLASRRGQFVSSSVASSFRDWFWTADPRQTARVGGLAAVRMNLGRLARAQRRPIDQPAKLLPVGEMSGNIKLAAQSGQVVAVVDLSGKQIQIQSPQPTLPGEQPTLKTIWREPTLRVAGTISYSPEADRLNFDGLQTQSSTLTLASNGSILGLSSDQRVNLAGTMDYDLASLSPIIAQYVGEGLAIAGREQARFEVKGALASIASTQALAGPTGTPARVAFSQASNSSASNSSSPGSTQNPTSWYARVHAPWQSASFYGLPIGPGRLSAELRQGQLVVEPFDFVVGGGRFTASPSIQLNPAPGQLTLPAGPIFTDIRITPDVSERLLKFIAPVLSGATQTEGLFSMSLSGANVPLGAPKTADVAGQLAVQSVRMVPGPSTAELVSLVRQIEALIKARDFTTNSQRNPITLLSISDRTVDFRLVDGRVYHQGLEFQVGNWLIRSRGSVGLDDSLSLMLELQVPQRGLGRSFQKLGITRLEVPVTGTLQKWNFDTRAVFDSIKQQAVGQLLNEETIGNALDKLFGSGR